MLKPAKRLLLTCTAALVCAFAAEDLSAQGMPSFFKKQSSRRNRTDAPTIVEAATMDIDIENNIATLLGNVVVDDQDSKITCDKMIIYLEDKEEPKEESVKSAKEDEEEAGGKQLKKIECFGEVVITHKADKNNKNAKDQVATSDFAVYDMKKEEIVLTGRPVLTSGTDKLNADKLVFEMKTGKVKITQGIVTYYGDTELPDDKAKKNNPK